MLRSETDRCDQFFGSFGCRVGLSFNLFSVELGELVPICCVGEICALFLRCWGFYSRRGNKRGGRCVSASVSLGIIIKSLDVARLFDRTLLQCCFESFCKGLVDMDNVEVTLVMLLC